MRQEVSCAGENGIDQHGRAYFLRAIQARWWPAPLDTLAECAAPIQTWLHEQSQFKELKHSPFPTGFNWIGPYSDWVTLNGSESITAIAARTALEHWHQFYRIPSSNEWLLDVAVRTVLLQCLYGSRQPVGWGYETGQVVRPEFTPKRPAVRTWLYGESRKQFRRRMRSGFNKSLDAYCSAIAATEGHRQDDELVAHWTARLWIGEPYKEIAAGRIGKKLESPINTATKYVERYCRRINLKLPPREVRRPFDPVFT